MKNVRLKQAIQVLDSKNEAEIKKLENKIEKYQRALEILPELKEKIKDYDEMKMIYKKKEEEVDELKQRIDEGAENNDMIEMLTQEMMKKDEEIIEMKRNLIEFKVVFYSIF